MIGDECEVLQREPNASEVRLLEKQGFNPEQWIVAWSDCEILEVVSKRSHRRWKIKKENRKKKNVG